MWGIARLWYRKIYDHLNGYFLPYSVLKLIDNQEKTILIVWFFGIIFNYIRKIRPFLTAASCSLFQEPLSPLFKSRQKKLIPGATKVSNPQNFAQDSLHAYFALPEHLKA